jgi:hypothetical protein
MDTSLAGHIAGRRNNAAFTATDNDGPISEFRIVALFHRRIKGVTINMGDVQVEHFGMASYVMPMA